jgi:5-carboxymethyl-2-hydroxymuconic-semialdehyde dehydrogenase
VDAAADAAQAAFRSWRKVGGAQRRTILHKVADLIESRSEQIALVECMDTGQALRFMKKAAERGAENFRYFADRAPSAADGLSLPDSL